MGGSIRANLVVIAYAVWSWAVVRPFYALARVLGFRRAPGEGEDGQPG